MMREVYPRLDTSALAPFTAGLDHWRHHVYNSQRPHEAVADRPPVTRWRPSVRRRPAELPAVDYPPGSVVRRVGSNGQFHYRRGRILAGQGLAGESVRVEEGDGCVVVWYAAHEIRRIPLARLDESGIL